LTRPLLIKGVRLLDGQAWNGELADLLVIDGRIADIGISIAPPSEAKVFDGTNYLVHPGLVNGHTHGHGSLAKGTGDRWTLELLLAAGPWISGARSPEDRRLAAQINAAEMALKGVTSAYDLFFELPTPTAEGITEAANGYGDVGLRVTIAPMLADRTLYQAVSGLLDALPDELCEGLSEPRPFGESVSEIERLIHGWSLSSNRAQLGLAPTISAHCSDELLSACRALSEEFGLPVHSHVSESKVQLVSGRLHWGGSVVDRLEAAGLLNKRFTAAHGVWLTQADMEKLGVAQSTVALNVGSNMRLGNGLPDPRGMVSNGINLAIGTDGSNSSDNQNMYEALRLASFASRLRGTHPDSWLTAAETIEAATLGGAQSMGWQDWVGKLAVGMAADLAFLDLATINWLPVNVPLHQLVHTEDGNAVRHVMVGGEWIVRNRQLTRIDVQSLAQSAHEARARLAKKTRKERETFLRLAPLVAEYCQGLAYDSATSTSGCGCGWSD